MHLLLEFAQHYSRVANWFSGLLNSNDLSDTNVFVIHGTVIEYINTILIGTPVNSLEKSWLYCHFANYHLWLFDPQTNKLVLASSNVSYSNNLDEIGITTFDSDNLTFELSDEEIKNLKTLNSEIINQLKSKDSDIHKTLSFVDVYYVR